MTQSALVEMIKIVIKVDNPIRYIRMVYNIKRIQRNRKMLWFNNSEENKLHTMYES
jgi:hypothetical protein